MPNVKFLYVRNSWDRRDISIASDIIDDNGKKYVKFGWAFRSNHDQFIKRDGRDISLNRMITNDEKYSAKVEIEEFKFYDIAEKMLHVIADSPYTPKKFKEDIFSDIRYYKIKNNKTNPDWSGVFPS